MKRSKAEISDVLNTALGKISATAWRELTDHDREWVQAIRYWLEGADEEESVRRVRAERTGRCHECGGPLEGWAGERHSQQCSRVAAMQEP